MKEAEPSEAEPVSDPERKEEDPTKVYIICENCRLFIFEYEEKNATCQCHPGETYGCFWQEVRGEGASVDTFACFRSNGRTMWARARMRAGVKSQAEMAINFPTGGSLRFSPISNNRRYG